MQIHRRTRELKVGVNSFIAAFGHIILFSLVLLMFLFLFLAFRLLDKIDEENRGEDVDET